MGKISAIDKEKSLLGSLFLSREAINIVINNNFNVLEMADDFHKQVADNILQICRVQSETIPSIENIIEKMNIKEKDINSTRVKLNRYKKMVQRDIVSDTQYYDLTVNNIKGIRDAYIKRNIVDKISKGLDKIDLPASEFLSYLNKDITSIEVENQNIQEIHIHTGFKDVKAEMLHQMENGEDFGFKTHFRDVDKILEPAGYFVRGSLSYIVGRPSNYKTGFALNIASNMAKNKTITAIISHEMSPGNCYRRLIAKVAGIEMAKLKKPSTLTQEEWDRIDKAIEEVESWPLYIIDGSTLNIGTIDALLAYMKSKYGLDVVFWDYFQLIRKRDNSIPTEERDFAENSEELRIMVKTYDIAGIALSQANRGCEQRDDKRPTMKDIRSTGKAEQDAENILYVYRDEFYYLSQSEMPNHLEIGALKVREGELKRALLHFNGAKATLGQCDPMIVMDKSRDYIGGGGNAE